MKPIVSLLVVVMIVITTLVVLSPEGRALIKRAPSDPDTNSDPHIVNKSPLELPLVEPRIEVSKRKRELTLYSAGRPVRVYRAGLGSNPKDDKHVKAMVVRRKASSTFARRTRRAVTISRSD